MTDVTQILSQIEKGDPRAAEQLLPLVYDELRRLAAKKLAQEKPGQTLDARRGQPRGKTNLSDRCATHSEFESTHVESKRRKIEMVDPRGVTGRRSGDCLRVLGS